MRKSYKKKTKDKIMEAAWKLFYEQGYEETTISDIIEKSGTSRSAFYHHFHGKEELLFSVAYTYDIIYEDWDQNLPPEMHTVEKLKSFNEFVMRSVEDSPYRCFYSTLYGLQVMTGGMRHILNQDRKYYQILRDMLKEGLECGEIISSYSYTTLADMITSFQIGFTYSWCLQKERFSLLEYARAALDPFLESLRAK
ncbi:MAG: TetR/AcrR family transcriptional regulator [Bariatricus sp.]|nr:TetR/AcrR family transcriptional regulator [Bariatricus sp.]